MATGVLALVVGRATRLAQFLSGHEKKYVARIRLGMSTDSWDRTGAIVSQLEPGVPLPGLDDVATVLHGVPRRAGAGAARLLRKETWGRSRVRAGAPGARGRDDGGAGHASPRHGGGLFGAVCRRAPDVFSRVLREGVGRYPRAASGVRGLPGRPLPDGQRPFHAGTCDPAGATRRGAGRGRRAAGAARAGAARHAHCRPHGGWGQAGPPRERGRTRRLDRASAECRAPSVECPARNPELGTRNWFCETPGTRRPTPGHRPAFQRAGSFASSRRPGVRSSIC